MKSCHWSSETCKPHKIRHSFQCCKMLNTLALKMLFSSRVSVFWNLMYLKLLSHHKEGKECISSFRITSCFVCLDLGFGKNGMYFMIGKFLIRSGSKGSYREMSPWVYCVAFSSGFSELCQAVMPRSSFVPEIKDFFFIMQRFYKTSSSIEASPNKTDKITLVLFRR